MTTFFSLLLLLLLLLLLVSPGETIVGDGTTAQLCVLLTGIAEKHQPEARRSERDSDIVDKWRWIFKDFKQQGYNTLFSEDSPRYASFSYRLICFKDPPTDHYSRPFWTEAENVTKSYYIGGRASLNISLEYLMSFYRAYKDRPKFSLVTHSVISYDDKNTIGYTDDDLKNNFSNHGKRVLSQSYPLDYIRRPWS